MDLEILRSLFTSHESLVETLVLAIALVIVLPLVRAFGPRAQRHSGRSLLFFGLHVFCYTFALLLHAAGFEESVEWLHAGQHLFAAFTLVALGGYLVFDFALPLFRVEVVTLTYELVVGLGYIIAAAMVFAGLGVDLTNVVAASTIAAAILSISLQNTLGNVVGGVALQLDGSFTVGDWLQLENGRQGQVRSIRWRHTVLATRDGDTIIVPNAYLLSSQLVLLGRRPDGGSPHRITVLFQLDTIHAPDRVVRLVIDALRAAPLENVAAEPPPDCVCLDLARDNRDGYIVYAVRYFVEDLWPDEPTSSRVRARVHAALTRQGIRLGVPSLQLQHSPAAEAAALAREDTRAHARAALRAVDIFDELDDAEIGQLAAALVETPYTDGEVITREGEVADQLYLLAAGEVRVQRAGQSGPLAVLRAPDFFGEMGLLTGEPRGADVVAVGPVACWRLDRAPFDRLLRHRPDFAAKISARVAVRRVGRDEARPGEEGPSAEREHARLLARMRQFFRLDP